MKITLILIALSSTLIAKESTKHIDQLAPNSEFSYGHHKLKWTADTNTNQRMDLGEVSKQLNGAWTALNDAEFKQTILRRRASLYMENAYIYKKTPTRDLELYADFPSDWKATDKRPAIIWFFGGAWNTGTPFAFKPQADYFSH